MKKILLVLMLIFLGHNAFAMYCWEEVSGQFNYESKMTEKLGASNIVKVSTMLTAAGATYYECSHGNATTTIDNNNTDAYWGYSSWANYGLGDNGGWYKKYVCTSSIYTNSKFQVYGDFGDYTTSKTLTNSYNNTNTSIPGITTGRIYSYIYYRGTNAPYEQNLLVNNSTYGLGETTRNNRMNEQIGLYYTKHNYYLLHNPHYTHTFCTTVGGGGGGAAGAVVNYIIKAD